MTKYPYSDPIPFYFVDPRQQKIYEELNQLVGPGPAAFFRDACWLIQNPDTLESTSHLVGHLLREIESAIRSVLLPIAEETADEELKPGSQKDQIKVILKTFNIAKETREARAWFELADQLHSIAHRCSLERPRPPHEVQDFWEKLQTLLEIILCGIRQRFLKWFPILDNLLSKPQPTTDDIKTLVNKVPHNFATRGYFFDRLENPEWLEPLRKKGFFSASTSPYTR